MNFDVARRFEKLLDITIFYLCPNMLHSSAQSSVAALVACYSSLVSLTSKNKPPTINTRDVKAGTRH